MFRKGRSWTKQIIWTPVESRAENGAREESRAGPSTFYFCYHYQGFQLPFLVSVFELNFFPLFCFNSIERNFDCKLAIMFFIHCNFVVNHPVPINSFPNKITISHNSWATCNRLFLIWDGNFWLGRTLNMGHTNKM